MANDKKSARKRRELKRKGAKKLGPITVEDPKTWAGFLIAAGVLHLWGDGEPTEEQLRHATEKLISEACRRERKAEADAILKSVSSKIPKFGPGLSSASLRLSLKKSLPSTGNHLSGGHWSYRPGQQTDEGRTYTPRRRLTSS